MLPHNDQASDRAGSRPLAIPKPPALLIWLSLGLSGLLFSGCVPETTQAKAKGDSAATNQAPRWNWEFYPPLPRMRIATLPCQLLPKSSITIHSPMVGVLKVYAQSPQTNLCAGYVWAEFEPTIFAAEAEALEEARLKLDEREKLQLELELPKQKMRLEKDLEEAARQVSLLHLLTTNKELARASFNFAGPDGNPLKPEALTKAELELDLLRKSYSYLEQTNLTVLGIDLPGQRSEWQRRKLDFDHRQAQARLKMPFDGQLTISLPLTDGVDEYPVNLSQELAVARDLSLIRLRVVLSNPAWVGLPADRLLAVVRLANGEELQAPFVFHKIERIQMREESVYYFQFPSEKSAAAARLMGTDVSCELWMTLPRPARIVPKLALVLNQSSSFQGRNWAQGVQSAWPGARVLIEGQTDVAIILPNDPVRL
jgi:hypothetical protein